MCGILPASLISRGCHGKGVIYACSHAYIYGWGRAVESQSISSRIPQSEPTTANIHLWARRHIPQPAHLRVHSSIVMSPAVDVFCHQLRLRGSGANAAALDNSAPAADRYKRENTPHTLSTASSTDIIKSCRTPHTLLQYSTRFSHLSALILRKQFGFIFPLR